MKMLRPAFFAAIAAGGIAVTGAIAQSSDAPAASHIRQVVIYGNDPCPRGTGDEVVVCARRPDNERFRIPKSLRDDDRSDEPSRQSWSENADSLARVGNVGIGSCSPTGSGGASGCWQELTRKAREERRNPPPK